MTDTNRHSIIALLLLLIFSAASPAFAQEGDGQVDAQEGESPDLKSPPQLPKPVPTFPPVLSRYATEPRIFGLRVVDFSMSLMAVSASISMVLYVIRILATPGSCNMVLEEIRDELKKIRNGEGEI